jgi:hypothetical protein
VLSFHVRPAEGTVSLPESIRDYQGQLLCFGPQHGWGWFRLSAGGGKVSLDYGAVDSAGAFHIRVHRFFTFQGELRGIVGRVEQVGHLFDGLWATTWTMLVGEHDLTDNLCWRWDIELGVAEPSGDDWPAEPVTEPAYFGHGGVLAVSRDAIEMWWAAVIGGRSAEPGAAPDRRGL